MAWHRDPVVWTGAVTGVLATAWALFAGRYLPYLDWANHVALIAAMAHGGSTGADAYLSVSWVPGPYFLFYALSAVGAYALPVDVAAKLVVSASAAAYVIGPAWLAQVCGRSPRLGVIGPLAMFGISMGYGFSTFVVATPILLFVLAATERLLFEDPSPRRYGALALCLGLAFVGHGLIFLIACAAVGCRALIRSAAVRNARPLGQVMMGASPAVLIALPFIIDQFVNPWAEAKDGAPKQAQIAELTSLAEREIEWARHLLDRGSADHVTLMWWTVALFVALCLSSPRLERRRPRSYGLEIYALLATGAYLFGPVGIGWPMEIWLIYPRFGVIAALLLFLLPRVDLRGVRTGLVGAMLALVVSNAQLNGRQVALISTWAGAYDRVRAHVPPCSRVLALTVPIGDDPPLPHEALRKLHFYHMVDGASYVGFLFDTKGAPVRWRRDVEHPRTPFWRSPDAYQPDVHGVAYDYLVLRGSGLVDRTEQAGLHERIAREDQWVVFRTKNPPARRGRCRSALSGR